MARIAFRLTMPGTGRRGKDRSYVLVRSMSTEDADALLEGKTKRTWWHRWDDGWVAQIDASPLAPHDRAPKSHGFAGYDWMVDNILRHGDPYNRDAKAAS